MRLAVILRPTSELMAMALAQRGLVDVLPLGMLQAEGGGEQVAVRNRRRRAWCPPPPSEMAPAIPTHHAPSHSHPDGDSGAPLDASCRGYGLLCRLAWRGGGLGRRGDGGEVPVAELLPTESSGRRGLGTPGSWLQVQPQGATGPRAPRPELMAELAAAAGRSSAWEVTAGDAGEMAAVQAADSARDEAAAAEGAEAGSRQRAAGAHCQKI